MHARGRVGTLHSQKLLPSPVKQRWEVEQEELFLEGPGSRESSS